MRGRILRCNIYYPMNSYMKSFEQKLRVHLLIREHEIYLNSSGYNVIMILCKDSVLLSQNVAVLFPG